MAVTYSTTAKNNRHQATIDLIDAGAGNGVLEIGTAGMSTVLASITLAKPCGTKSGGVLTLTLPQSDTDADATGTAAAARIKDSNGTTIVSGLTVGTSAADIIMNSVAIQQHAAVTVGSGTITHA